MTLVGGTSQARGGRHKTALTGTQMLQVQRTGHRSFIALEPDAPDSLFRRRFLKTPMRTGLLLGALFGVFIAAVLQWSASPNPSELAVELGRTVQRFQPSPFLTTHVVTRSC